MGKGWTSLVGLLFVTACTRAPSPLALSGSVGLPHRGVLTESVEIPGEGPGYRFLRDDDRHFGLPRFANALTRAAARVEQERPGRPLVIGDLSVAHGGRLLPHFSHRTGRDADLLLYATTLEGAPVESPGFVHYGPDGLAWDDKHHRFLRFDVEREWILVKALLEDPEARIQWMFSNHAIEAMLVDWARARGEPTELIWRAETVLLEPHPGGDHDDHIHVRCACSEEDIVHGCEPSGPERPWLALQRTPAFMDVSNEARELLVPLPSNKNHEVELAREISAGP